MRMYTHCCRPIDPIRRGGQKKNILLLRQRQQQQNKREHLVNKKPDTIFKRSARRREALRCRRQVFIIFYTLRSAYIIIYI